MTSTGICAVSLPSARDSVAGGVSVRREFERTSEPRRQIQELNFDVNLARLALPVILDALGQFFEEIEGLGFSQAWKVSEVFP
jgi:hypothetical protein